jgi:hypothetical protein
LTKRERMISILVRRAGGMRTMLLVGLIESYPRRMYDGSGWFSPNHSELQRKIRVKVPVYWTLLRGLCDRGLVEKRITDQSGHEYRIDFGAIETYCKYGRIELFIRWVKRVTVGLKVIFKGRGSKGTH